ncbi:MAG: YfbR-like 5'-deoxynucleotidase [Nanoarchaeota archaeon]
MEFPEIVLEGFEGREEALNRIKRYIHKKTPVMYYRTTDLIHSRRVLWHLEEALSHIVSVYGKKFDVDFTRTLAFVHDDAEIINGDVQLRDKERMTPEELDALAKKEREAIPLVVRMYSQIANGYDYSMLLHATKDKISLEAQFVSFFDKFDGAGEAWHELWAGNKYFLTPAGGSDGNDGYIRRLREFPKKYPALINFFEEFPDYIPEHFDFDSVLKNGKLHTRETLGENSGYEPYKKWKRTIIRREGIENLLTQLEHE